MCKILTPKEKESLAKLTKLVEGLTNKKIVLESRKDCNCCGDKKSLKENTYKSYMGNKGEKVYITPTKVIEGARFPEFRLINAVNYWMINMTFSSPEEAKKYATKRELTIVPKPKETFSERRKPLRETLDQSYSDMEDLAEAIVSELGSHLPVHEEAKIRNIILSNISTDKTSNEGKIRDVVKILGGKGEVKVRELFKYYNANLNESTAPQLNSQKNYDLSNLIIKPGIIPNSYSVLLNDKVIGGIRLNQRTISLDSNKTGKTRTELYYTLSWDRDICKDIFGVEFHNGSRKEEGKVNAVNYKVGKTTYKENPFTIKRIKKYLEQELESLKPKTVTESTEGIQRIKMQYSKENISRLWDSFSIKTRKMIANFGNAWENKDININSFFIKQSEKGQSAIIEYFEHHGVNKLIDINKRTMKESKQNLKEGVWALPKDAVARRKAMNFKQELQRIKTDIYNIAGSDDLYNALDNAIESLDELITAGKSQGNI